MLVDYGLSLPKISHWYLGTYEGCPVRVFVALYLETLSKLSFQVNHHPFILSFRLGLFLMNVS